MRFTILVHQNDRETDIHISGSRELITTLEATLRAAQCYIRNINEYSVWYATNESVPSKSFTINLYNLKNFIDVPEKSVSTIDLLLSTIEQVRNANPNRADVSIMDLNLLKYWQLEVKMIRNGQSYRSKHAMPMLTASNVLCRIFERMSDNFSLLPTYDLFQSLENSRCIREYGQAVCSPLLYEYEIQELVQKIENNTINPIRTAARLMNQGSRSSTSTLFRMPVEITTLILGFVSNPNFITREKSVAIARRFFCRPAVLPVSENSADHSGQKRLGQ